MVYCWSVLIMYFWSVVFMFIQFWYIWPLSNPSWKPSFMTSAEPLSLFWQSSVNWGVLKRFYFKWTTHWVMGNTQYQNNKIITNIVGTFYPQLISFQQSLTCINEQTVEITHEISHENILWWKKVTLALNVT